MRQKTYAGGYLQRPLALFFFAAIAICIFSSCSVSFCAAKVTTLKIAPRQTDPAISDFLDDHIVKFDKSKINVKDSRIVVFLPGSHGKPSNQALFQNKVASMGYLSIGLMYPNDPTIGSLCQDDTGNKYCYWDTRREIIQGENFSDKVYISPAESILNRVQKLLVYLQNEDPISGFPWGLYYDSSKSLNQSVIWSNITISGHSQGGGHATLIAYLYDVYKLITFSSTCDTSLDGYLWTESPPMPRVSNVSKFFGFISKIDPICAGVNDNWSKGGYLGKIVTVDDSNSGGGRQLCSALFGDCYNAHGSTVVDSHLMRQWNNPSKILVEDTWDFLLSADPNNAGVDTGENGEQECKLSHCNIVGFLIWVFILILFICPIPLVYLYVYNQRNLYGKIPFRPNEMFKGTLENMRNILILDYVIYLVISIIVCAPLYFLNWIKDYLYWALIAIATSLLETALTIQWMKKIDSSQSNNTSSFSAAYTRQQTTPFFTNGNSTL